ncbi:MAG: FAD-dependent oxidoreductase [Nitrococcus sp.]|nr:FAD-dependent oxidoreductase [Nitrococcus sp.]
MRRDSSSVSTGGILDIAVIGSGISGLSCAWLLSTRHRVTLFEAEHRLGGHSHTVTALDVAVDTGFIVYNGATYPNFAALLRHLGVITKPSEMSFAVSLDDGRLEYSGSGCSGLFAQGRNVISPRFWRMLRDIVRFYRKAPLDAPRLGTTTLDNYLDTAGYSAAFRNDHLYPMAAAIWSTPAAEIGSYPAAGFIRFCQAHGLLKLSGRPIWRTVDGGSRAYVQRMAEAIPRILSGQPIEAIRRHSNGVEVSSQAGGCPRHFDHVVIATHADQALRMLADASADERRVLGAFRYVDNDAVLHSDPNLMPSRRKVWSSWNYLSCGAGDGKQLAVTYWMNRLQGIDEATPLYVTLNPHRRIRDGRIVRRLRYRHPSFNTSAMAAQEELWSLQGMGNTWFCGSYFGAGFHEDGLQAGLAVAEALGDTRRPWTVADESGRIHVHELATTAADTEAA